MKIGYIRVSTDQQSHQRQLDGLQSHCDEVHCETVSAVKKKRPVYQKVIKKLKRGDSIVVWDLDRAFRSTIDALTEVEKLRERGVEFQIVTLNVDTATPNGELIYTVMAAFAQFERQTLARRTREGMEAARAKGKHIGRPFKLSEHEITQAGKRVLSGRATITSMAYNLGCSRGTLAEGFKRMGMSI